MRQYAYIVFLCQRGSEIMKKILVCLIMVLMLFCAMGTASALEGVYITSPIGQKVTGDVEITITATTNIPDAHIGNVYYGIDSDPISPAIPIISGWTFIWYTADFTEGTHTIKVMAEAVNTTTGELIETYTSQRTFVLEYPEPESIVVPAILSHNINYLNGTAKSVTITVLDGDASLIWYTLTTNDEIYRSGFLSIFGSTDIPLTGLPTGNASLTVIPYFEGKVNGATITADVQIKSSGTTTELSAEIVALEKTISELEAEIEAKETYIEVVEGESARVDEAITEAEETIAELTEDNDQLKTDIMGLNTKIRNLEKENNVSPITFILLIACIILGFILWNDEAYAIFKTIIADKKSNKLTSHSANMDAEFKADNEPIGSLALSKTGKKNKSGDKPNKGPEKYPCKVEGCDKSSSTLAGLMAHHRGAHKDIDWDELYKKEER